MGIRRALEEALLLEEEENLTLIGRKGVIYLGILQSYYHCNHSNQEHIDHISVLERWLDNVHMSLLLFHVGSQDKFQFEGCTWLIDHYTNIKHNHSNFLQLDSVVCNLERNKKYQVADFDILELKESKNMLLIAEGASWIFGLITLHQDL